MELNFVKEIYILLMFHIDKFMNVFVFVVNEINYVLVIDVSNKAASEV